MVIIKQKSFILTTFEFLMRKNAIKHAFNTFSFFLEKKQSPEDMNKLDF